MNYYLLSPFYIICLVAILIWVIDERNVKTLKKINNNLLLDGRDVATILFNSIDLKIVLDQTKKNNSEFYDESKSKLFLPDIVLNKTTIYALIITIKEIASIVYLKGKYSLKSFLEAVIVILSTIGFILLIFSLVFQTEIIYITSLILLYLCIILSLILVLIYLIVRENTLKLIEKYNMVENINEKNLINKYLNIYVFVPITYATLPMIEIFKYIKDSF